MNLYWHKKANNSDLLLIFNGWGCDEHILSGVEKDGYDILLLSDYLNLNNSFLEEVQKYRSIQVLAWSFGVSIANYFLPFLPRVSHAIAINGTVHPIDNTEGIPFAIYEATLNNLSEKSRDKFFRRMMGGKNNMDRYKSFLPHRSLISQIGELRKFLEWNSLNELVSPSWDGVVIGTKDGIFPPQNMQNCWSRHPIKLRNEYHYIPFQEIIDSYL